MSQNACVVLDAGGGVEDEFPEARSRLHIGVYTTGRARVTLHGACSMQALPAITGENVYIQPMTRPIQKNRERFFAEQAARSLGKTWGFSEDREHPDFIVTEGAQPFGLEICEVFMGPQSRAGSAMKAKESTTQRRVNGLRLEYEAIANIPLTVKFVGNMSAANMATVVPALVAEDFPSKPISHHVVFDSGSGLRVHVTKAFRPDWYSVNDRVGFVDRNPGKIIADAIEKKAKELTRYKDSVGLDIRLLLVADRIQNSGKLMLEERAAFDFQGFQAVYFFPYPESVIILDDAIAS